MREVARAAGYQGEERGAYRDSGEKSSPPQFVAYGRLQGSSRVFWNRWGIKKSELKKQKSDRMDMKKEREEMISSLSYLSFACSLWLLLSALWILGARLKALGINSAFLLYAWSTPRRQ